MDSCYGLIYRVAVLSLLASLAGCASTPTPLEQDYNERAARDNWAMCQYAYKQNNVGMHFDHPHMDDEHIVLIRWDLGQHSCESILDDYWIEELR